MSWHTYYRPHQVSDLHLSDVRELLLSLMKSGKFPHVFLCAGPKGTGKTSTARIIGALLNDPANAEAVDQLFFAKKTAKKVDKPIVLVEPDGISDQAKNIFDGQSFTVQELDAASNRGIDDIRQLKERVALPPQEGKVAVYILDEVHMLTNEAFNALLKLLEEPPAHAVFVLATTELHKVPATIQSRCVMLPFRKATLTEIAAAIGRVAGLEKVSLEPAAAELLAELADGSFRDAIKSLELVASTANGSLITKDSISELLHVQFEKQLPSLVQAVVDKQETVVVSTIEELRSKGTSSAAVHKALVHFLHRDLLRAVGVVEGKAQFASRVDHFLLQELNQLPVQQTEALPLLGLEVKLLEMIYRAQDKSNGTKTGSGNGAAVAVQSKKKAESSSKAKVASPAMVKDVSVKEAPPVGLEPTIDTLAAFEPEAAAESIANVVEPSDLDTRPLLEAWSSFVEQVEKKNSTVAAFLRSAKPLIEESNGVAKIEVYYKFHRDQLIQPKFLDMLKTCAEPLVGGRPNFEFIVSTRSEAALADEVLM